MGYWEDDHNLEMELQWFVNANWTELTQPETNDVYFYNLVSKAASYASFLSTSSRVTRYVATQAKRVKNNWSPMLSRYGWKLSRFCPTNLGLGSDCISTKLFARAVVPFYFIFQRIFRDVVF